MRRSSTYYFLVLKKYSCNSIDRVANVPMPPKLSENEKSNLGKTGNLPTVLKLKVGAPVVVTSNHKKRKYKEDGIVNGARGYVQAIQTDIANPEKVNAVWVVFNDEKIGRRYRAENYHLRQNFNPGHPLAVAILPERKTFQTGRGGIQYQRTNFPLCLGYAVTAHKCQGLTLEEVIIDFAPDKEKKIKNFLQFGSFYVALTRVRNGSKVFLKSFDPSYIVENKSIETKLEAFKQLNSYRTKKIYVNDKVFESEVDELKVAYLNCNGLMVANHCEFINHDKNLINVDLLSLAETKLTESYSNEDIELGLTNWKVVKRFDATDGKAHMGILLIIPLHRYDSVAPYISTISELELHREKLLHIQGLKVRFLNNDGLELGFIYSREAPSIKECEAFVRKYNSCHLVLGDLNLSTKIDLDKKKLDILCSNNKFLALHEITRIASSNQLDHILVDQTLSDHCYCTSYLNFISDHKAIVARINSTAKFSHEFLQKINFSEEKHTKHIPDRQDLIDETRAKPVSKMSKREGTKSKKTGSRSKEKQISLNTIDKSCNRFVRCFKNPDSSKCWLNACLQLILIGLDHFPHDIQLQSPLGLELLSLYSSQGNNLDPTNIENIIMSEEMERRRNNPNALFLNLDSGQQCVRDFFIALTENVIAWPDVFSLFSFQLIEESKCDNSQCNNKNISEHNPQIYIEMEVPDSNSDLSYFVEKQLNESESIDYYHCEKRYGGCGNRGGAEHSTKIKTLSDRHFLIVILRRLTMTEDNRFEINDNRVSATGDIKIASKNGITSKFKPVAVIDHRGGNVRSDGTSQGHYICDISTKDGHWFHTSDNDKPCKLNKHKVTKYAAVVLYKKVL